MKKVLNLIVIMSASILLFAGAKVLLYAFESVQTEAVIMEVEVGGEVPPAPQAGFQILHKSLQGISPVTKLAIIQGNVGTDILVAQNVRSAAADSRIRMTVRFRFFEEGNPGGGDIHVSSTVYYNDPTPFFFQIDPNEIKSGIFQYQIIAEKLDENNVVVSTDSIPADAFGQRDTSWISAGIQAGAAPIFGAEGGRISIPDGNPNDGESSLDIPAGVFKVPTQISINEVRLDDGMVPQGGSLSSPLALYRIDSTPPFNGAVRVSVIYPEYMPTANGWNLSGTPVSHQTLTLGIWDGFTWRPLSGRIDANSKLLTARVGYAKYVGVFAGGAATPDSIAPVQKIITPNGDGVNDTADFTGIGATTKVNIFDVSGHNVRTILGPNNFAWDGKDESGKIVESGVYIYQFSEGGQRVSGVIAVAK